MMGLWWESACASRVSRGASARGVVVAGRRERPERSVETGLPPVCSSIAYEIKGPAGPGFPGFLFAFPLTGFAVLRNTTKSRDHGITCEFYSTNSRVPLRSGFRRLLACFYILQLSVCSWALRGISPHPSVRYMRSCH